METLPVNDDIKAMHELRREAMAKGDLQGIDYLDEVAEELKSPSGNLAREAGVAAVENSHLVQLANGVVVSEQEVAEVMNDPNQNIHEEEYHH